MVSSMEVVVGWHEHHSKMFQAQKFSTSFETWHDMDRQIHTQFIDNPFVIEPMDMTYMQLFEQV